MRGLSFTRDVLFGDDGRKVFACEKCLNIHAEDSDSYDETKHYETLGSLAEEFFRIFCRQNDIAYASTKSIDECFNKVSYGSVIFDYGLSHNIIKLPGEIAEEVRRFSRPSFVDPYNNSYTIDYLTLQLKGAKRKAWEFDNKVDNYTWVEVKSRTQKLSKNQEAFFGTKTLIDKVVFRAAYVSVGSSSWIMNPDLKSEEYREHLKDVIELQHEMDRTTPRRLRKEWG